MPFHLPFNIPYYYKRNNYPYIYKQSNYQKKINDNLKENPSSFKNKKNTEDINNLSSEYFFEIFRFTFIFWWYPNFMFIILFIHWRSEGLWTFFMFSIITIILNYFIIL